MRSGLEIQAALQGFVAKWQGYSGTERAEAQSFLNDLFAAYGTDRREVGALFEDFTSSAGFMDLHWPSVLIVEMKAPHVALEKARDQRQRYWQESSNSVEGIPAARYVIACNFGEFEIWEPGRFPNEARIRFPLAELPDRYDSLLFLQAQTAEPVFAEHRRELTTEAAKHVAELYTSLADRAAAPIDEIQRFTMQLVWCLFAEDLGMLDGYPLQNTVDALIADPNADSARDIGYLFTLLNQKGDHNRQGRYAGTRYVNGELFAKPAAVFMNRDELVHLRQAAEFNWKTVDPTIFGSLMEGVLGEERRERLGAHYTHEADIMKIVGPTIVRPWRERIDAANSVSGAHALLDELCRFRVLDPSCGCGNFLYVAYRELRSLEFELKQKIVALAASSGTAAPSLTGVYYPLSNIYGIDIENIAVLIARVTLWMGHRQMVDRFGEAEPVLPLIDLSGIRRDDALRADWPEVEAIIGNPPFLGSQLLRAGLGGDYVDWLKNRFGAGVKDLCVYWFRKAHDSMLPGQRAGLVGTKSIAQNSARAGSLDYIVANGGVITDAISNQKWPGDAKVHVSIVNWVKQPESEGRFTLDGDSVIGITASLREATNSGWVPKPLAVNANRSFQGPIPVGSGFIVSPDVAAGMLATSPIDYSEVVRPYLTSSDIADDLGQRPSRWIIDFAQKTLEAALRFPLALSIVQAEVKPFRQTVRRAGHRLRWWQYGEPRVGLRKALSNLERSIVVGAHGKRMLLAWLDSWTLASNANMVFAFDDDYSMGILMSRAHDAWAWAQSSTLKGDLRYTPTTVFATFPWPDPVSDASRQKVAAAASALYSRRSELCIEHSMGLTKLYNLMDEGGFTDLAALHKALDVAVAEAYGWPSSVAQDAAELVKRLTELNRQISTGERPYAPFSTAP